MASRIWITCDHEHLGPHLTRELPTAISNEGWCQGGSVLTEGDYVLIEKVDGEWPEWATASLSDPPLYELGGDGEAVKVKPGFILDALAGGES